MRLHNCVPPLKDEVVQVLLDAGVKTDTDLLLAGDPINVFNKLPPGHGINLRDFNDIIVQVAELAAAVPLHGDRLLEEESKAREESLSDNVLVGLPELDCLFGGLGSRRVIEFSGDAGSGKTVCHPPMLKRSSLIETRR